eukprot:CAMPEP_0170062188 /NCGR_PEP_ID=MMETSP0019_2-20121128/3503_1 /TAXON_ID=98059 /ORGANISM="Dinobryon sp., Strain UTEXLB2267" /LENGTH=444 /DNA_ID=CAMNT_0010268263 /DNA_START=456 /DNA_END=1786 /DNA_ORIENTATION=-
MGKKLLLPLTSPAVMPIFTTIIPLLSTLRILSRHSNGSESRIGGDALGHKVLLWIVLAIYHAAVTFLSLVPFSYHILAFLPVVKEFIIISIVWVQISPAFAGLLFKTAITPVLRRVASLLLANHLQEVDSRTASKSRTLFGVLEMMRIINKSQAAFLTSLFQDGVATFLALLFILMPNPLASVGMVIIALLLPAFRSSCTSPLVITSRQQRFSHGDSDSVAISVAEQHKQWLEYWVCIAVLWAMRIYGMKMWPSVVMLCSLWLQHSYFLGATRTISFIKEHTSSMIQRNHEILQENQRQLQQSEQQQLVLESNAPPSEDVSVVAATSAVSSSEVMWVKEERKEVGISSSTSHMTHDSLQITSENVSPSAPPFESPKNYDAVGKGGLRNRKHKDSEGKKASAKGTMDEMDSPGYNTRSKSAQKEKLFSSELKEYSVEREHVGPFT